MMSFLADFMISGEWLTAMIVAIIGAIGGVYVKARKDGEDAREVTIKGQPLRMMKTDRPVSFDQHNALDARVARIENHLDRIERDNGQQYRQLLEAGAEREMRLTEFFGVGLRAVHERLDAMLKTSTTPRR